VRFGPEVLSPMIPEGEADFLVVLAPTQVENNLHVLRKGGVLFTPDLVAEGSLPNRRSLNVALLGGLAHHLPFPDALWHAAIRASLPERLHDVNFKAFEMGRAAARAAPPPDAPSRAPLEEHAWRSQPTTASTRPARRTSCPSPSSAASSWSGCGASSVAPTTGWRCSASAWSSAKVGPDDVRTLDDVARLRSR